MNTTTTDSPAAARAARHAAHRSPSRPPAAGRGAAIATACATVLVTTLAASPGGAHAAPLPTTPADMEGPYYPDVLPADQDADLTRIAGSESIASGHRLDISGRVLDTAGQPQPGVRIEIWQTDAFGRYIHRGDRAPQPRDPAFQGFGATSTDAQGRYAFRTVLPRGYASRPAHIHARLLRAGRELLVTQIYLPGATSEPGLPARLIPLREARQTLQELGESAGGLTGRFDYVIDE